MEEGKYQLSLNYEGEEMLIGVDDLETATNLLNDPEAAQQYLQNLIEQEESAKISTQGNQPDLSIAEQTPGEEILGEQAIIWSTKRTTKSDQEATILLLDLRKQMSNQFADKTTRKDRLWADIAKVIIKKGYNLGDTPAEKCRQKFTNLQKAYIKYINNQKTTGSEKMEVPPFFEQINEILGEKHKINPVSLIYSVEDIPSTPTTDLNTNSEPNTSFAAPSERRTSTQSLESDIENRFSRKAHSKKYSKTNDLIKEIQEDRAKRSEQFEFFSKHLKNTEQQRDKLISILERSLNGSKKRKKSASSSDSD